MCAATESSKQSLAERQQTHKVVMNPRPTKMSARREVSWLKLRLRMVMFSRPMLSKHAARSTRSSSVILQFMKELRHGNFAERSGGMHFSNTCSLPTDQRRRQL